MITKCIKFPTILHPKGFERNVIRSLNDLLAKQDIPYITRSDTGGYLEGVKDSCKNIEIIFDLRKVYYIGLHEALNLIVLGEFCQILKGNKVKVLLPTNLRARKFLSTFGFFRYLNDWGTSLSGGRLDDDEEFTSGRLLRITRIQSADDVGGIASSLKVAEIARILRNMFGEKANRLADTILSEICQNVPEHSCRGGKGTGYCAVQSHNPVTERWTRGYDVGNTVEIAVVDGGIGIMQSLRDRYPNVFSCRSASNCIENVLTKGIPQDGVRERAGLLRVMKSASYDFRAILTCRSTDGLVQSGQEARVRKSRTMPFFPGTQFRLLLPIEQGTTVRKGFV